MSKEKDKKQSQRDLFRKTAKDHNCDEKTDFKKVIKKLIQPPKKSKL